MSRVQFRGVLHALEDAIISDLSRDYVLYRSPVDGYHSVDGKALTKAVRHGARKYAEGFREVQGDQKVVAFLSASHVSYLINILCLMTGDYVPLLLSPRNAVAGMTDLLRRSQAFALVYERNKSVIAKQLAEEVPGLRLVEAIQFEDLWDGGLGYGDEGMGVGFGLQWGDGGSGMDDPEKIVLALHSS